MNGPEHSAWAISRRRLLGMLGGVSVSGVFLADLLTGDAPDLLATSTPLPGPRLPRILSCRGWRAREPSGSVTVLTGRPGKILVHHTATANQPDPPLSLDELARAIQDNHMDNRGWIDSGQNFLVNRAGLVAEGRHRSLETLLTGRAFIEGAHCTGQNDHSIGIENQGTYTEANPPLALLAALRVLCAFVCLQYRIRPGQIYGHRDFSDTACPGDRLYAQLPSLRGGVARLLAAPAPVATPAPGVPRSAGPTPIPGSAMPTPIPGSAAARAGARAAPPVATPDLEAREFGDPSFGNLGAGSLGASAWGVGSPGVGSPPTWPLLRIADRGPAVLAAQHLLRAAGGDGVPADGAFGRTTADGVFTFQRQRGLELTGMIGGAAWPLLAVPVRVGQGGEADQAVQVLLRFGPGATEAVPNVVRRETWQRLLGTG